MQTPEYITRPFLGGPLDRQQMAVRASATVIEVPIKVRQVEIGSMSVVKPSMRTDIYQLVLMTRRSFREDDVFPEYMFVHNSLTLDTLYYEYSLVPYYYRDRIRICN